MSILIFINSYGFEIYPAWYPIDSKDVIIAYGDGDSLEDAKQNAFKNIVSKNIDNNITISDIEILKEEVLENHYFLKIKYVNLSILQQLTNALKKVVFKIDDETNKYLIHTPLLKQLNSRFGYFPDIKLDGQYIYLQGEKFLVKDREFPELFANIKSDDIDIDMDTNLTSNKRYFIQVSPKNDGYVTLLQIVDNTNVDILFANKKLKPNRFTIFPNFKLSDGLEVSLDDTKDKAEILTLAVLCKEQKDFSDFNNIFFDITSKKYMLSKLIDQIDDCNYTTVLTDITK